MYKIHSFTIFVNNQCNLNCSYCFVNKSDVHLEYSENIEIILISLLNRLIPGDQITIGFLGGEPLLNFQLIKEVVLIIKKLRENYKNINIILSPITTNGTIYDKENYSFLYLNDIELHFSIDNYLDNIYDKNRIHKEIKNYPIYSIIKTNIENYKKIFNKSPSISIVITKENVSDFFNIIKYYIKKNGVKHIIINHGVGKTGYDNKLANLYKIEYIKLIKYYITDCIKNNISIEPIEGIIVDYLFRGKNIEYIAQCSLWKDLYLSYNNNFYTCTFLAGLGNKKTKQHIFGNLKEGIDFEKLEKGYNNMIEKYDNKIKNTFKEKLDIQKIFCLRYGVKKEVAISNENVFELSKKLPLLFIKNISKENLVILKNKHYGC